MSARATVEDYYEALRRGEPLYPYFAEDEDVVKFGVSETLVGYDDVAEGLREQTRTTDDWTVRSDGLRVVERDAHAAVADTVFLSWTDTEREVERAFDTRWSGTLERRAAADVGVGGGDTRTDAGSDTGTDTDTAGAGDDEWVFAGLHVSVARELGDD